MRGFIVGSLVLIGLYVAGGDTASSYLGGGLDVVAAAVRRLSDPSVAGVPQKGFKTSLNPVAPPPQAGGSGLTPRPTSTTPAAPPTVPVISV